MKHSDKILIARAQNYAVEKHNEVNHRYDGESYYIHLNLVYYYASKFSYLLTEDIPETIAAAWTHDVIEDCRETYNDVKKELGQTVAEITYALTNLKGRTREERAGPAYYAGIRAVEGAVFIKICDRLANVSYSKSKGSKGMFKTYQAENEKFMNEMYQLRYKDMIDELKELIK